VVRASLRNPRKVLLDPARQTLRLFCNFAAHDGETVVHSRWNNWIGLAQNESVGLQGLQRLGKHFFAQALYLSPQFTEAMRAFQK
jgi:hypothetical protein